MLRRGSTIGKYRLEHRIGRGSFADVWRARDTVEDRRVALKVTHADVVREHGRDVLEKEARIAARLSHPNIVGIRNADWIDGRFVLATDLADRCLAQYAGAKRSGRIALRTVRDVAAGLAHAHAHRIMHRDVKPENILIFSDGRAALGDFGVSRFAKGASAAFSDAGTLGYIAPEQAYGRPRLSSDVFSLGLIAYELLTGKLPRWPFDWPADEMARFESRVPEPLRPVLRKAAQFNPDQRYPDAVSLHEALERGFGRLEAVHAPPSRRAPLLRTCADVPSALAVQAEVFRRRHGAELGMRYHCYRCEAPVAEEMAFCPWCGFADNAFSEVSTYPLVCPDCERGVLPEWTCCPWCYTGRFTGNGQPPRPDRLAVRRCGQGGCTGQLRAFMRYCPQCKRKPRRPWLHPALPDRCPRCRAGVSASFWHYCAWCGRPQTQAGRSPQARA